MDTYGENFNTFTKLIASINCKQIVALESIPVIP
jgi:hypothetical protein